MNQTKTISDQLWSLPISDLHQIRASISDIIETKIKSNYKLEINDWKLSLKKYLNTINYGTDLLKS